jgi:hypothetical protein
MLYLYNLPGRTMEVVEILLKCRLEYWIFQIRNKSDSSAKMFSAWLFFGYVLCVPILSFITVYSHVEWTEKITNCDLERIQKNATVP